MSASTISPALQDRLTTLHKQRGGTPASEEIVAVVEGILATMDGDLSQTNLKLYAELESLGRYIAEAKSEIAALRPEEIRNRHLPTATDELEAIVGATEQATNGILEAMEILETLTGEMSPELGEKITSAVTRVYEACNFQDITGQRITKVVKALQHIEQKVDGLLAVFGADLAERHKTQLDSQAGSEDEAPSEGVADKKLLNGPQLPDEASTQDEIDKLLADFG
jgi:chemotaxis protein CheZ